MSHHDNRDRLVRETFIELADTLVNDYEVHDLLTTLTEGCTKVLAVDAGGVLLLAADGKLDIAAAATTQMRALELFEMQQQDGPCYEAYTKTAQIVVGDLRTAVERWPAFVPRALELGFGAVAAFPLVLRDDTIGALTLFRREPGDSAEDDVAIARGFADIATIGILQERAVTDAEQRAAQLQHALDSRVVIEQAKGIMAERHGIDLAAAFEALRAEARRTQRRLRDVAREVIDGSLEPEGG